MSSRRDPPESPSFRPYYQQPTDYDAGGGIAEQDPWKVYGRIRGCLIGGAIGDALGAPLENLTQQRITT